METSHKKIILFALCYLLLAVPSFAAPTYGNGTYTDLFNDANGFSSLNQTIIENGSLKLYYAPPQSWTDEDLNYDTLSPELTREAGSIKYKKCDQHKSLNSGPMPICAHSAVWDPVNNRMIVYGGSTPSTIEASIYAYYPSSDSWSLVTPEGDSPLRNYWHTAVSAEWFDKDDNLHRGMITFAGGSPDIVPYGWHTNVGIFDFETCTWENRPFGSTSPWPSNNSVGPSAVWDDFDYQMIVFGGGYSGGTVELWLYNPSTNSWTQKIRNNPTDPWITLPRFSHSAVWDPVYHRMIVFGGTSYCDLNGDGIPQWERWNDLWFYYPESNTWEQKTPNNPTDPWPEKMAAGHSAVWDAQNNKMIVFGSSSTWAYDPSNNTWQKFNGFGELYPVSGRTAVWYEARKQVLVYGGIDPSNGRYNLLYAWYLGYYTDITKAFISPITTFESVSMYDSISWNAVTPGGSDIKFQISTSADGSLWTGFVGPDGKSISYYTSNSRNIWSGHNGQKFLKYKAFIKSAIYPNYDVTPVLNSVTINTINSATDGSANSNTIAPVWNGDGGEKKWNKLSFSSTIGGTHSITVEVIGTTKKFAGINGSNTFDISDISADSLQLKAALHTDDITTSPSLDDWGVSWLQAVARANGSHNPITVKAGQTINFDGSSSIGESLSYEWDFGDGSNKVNNTTATHYYQKVGTYIAALKVTQNGIEGRDQISITVAPGDLHHFDFDPIANQPWGNSFPINIYAKDTFENLKTDFTNERISLSLITAEGKGIMSPTETNLFVNGSLLDQRVTLYNEGICSIEAYKTGTPAQGYSNQFEVRKLRIYGTIEDTSAPKIKAGEVDDFIKITLKTSFAGAMWKKITIHELGTAEDSDFSNITIYEDLNGSGSFEAQEDWRIVGSGTLSFGSATINLSETVTTTPKTYFVVASLKDSAIGGHNIILKTEIQDFNFEVTNADITFAPESITTKGSEIEITVDTLSVLPQATTSGTISTEVIQGTKNVPIYAFNMRTDAHNATWKEIKIPFYGGKDSTPSSVKKVSIYKYMGSSPAEADFVLGRDVPVAYKDTNIFDANGVATIVLPNPIVIGTNQQVFFVVYDIDMDAPPGTTAGINIENASRIIVDAPDIAVLSTPLITQGPIIKPWEATVTVNPVKLAEGDTVMGAKNVKLAKFTLSTDAGSAYFCSFTVTSTGSPETSQNVSRVAIYKGENLIKEMNYPFIGSRTATLEFSTKEIIQKTGSEYFVVFDIEADENIVKEFDTVGLRVTADSFNIEAPCKMSSEGMPFESNILRILNPYTPSTPKVDVLTILFDEYSNEFGKFEFTWQSGSWNEVAQDFTKGVSSIRYYLSENPSLSLGEIPWILVSLYPPVDRSTISMKPLQLVHGKTYYLYVQTKSQFDRWSSLTITSGTLVDVTAPSTPGKPGIFGGGSKEDSSSITVGDGSYMLIWQPSADPESGIIYYVIEEKGGASPVWNTFAVVDGGTTQYAINKGADFNTYSYRIKAQNRAGSFSAYSEISKFVITGGSQSVIGDISNYPNPFNSNTENTVIAFILNGTYDVKIDIYDLMGYMVKSMYYPSLAPGAHSGDITWDGTNGLGQKVGMGGYIAKITVKTPAGDVSKFRKIGVTH